MPRERSGRRSQPQPTRSVADLLASFVAEASTEDSAATLIAKSLPVIHELGGTCVCVSLAITIQSRNVSDFSTSLAQVSRLRREGITTDKRSRALSQVLEETLVNTKQVLGIQLWISRAPARPFFNPNQRIGANLANVTKLKQFRAAVRGRLSVLDERLDKRAEHGEEIGRPQGIGNVPEWRFHSS